MASFGRVQEFYLNKESMSAYVERVELFSANGIEDNKKVPTFLISVGSERNPTKPVGARKPKRQVFCGHCCSSKKAL